MILLFSRAVPCVFIEVWGLAGLACYPWSPMLPKELVIAHRFEARGAQDTGRDLPR